MRKFEQVCYLWVGMGEGQPCPKRNCKWRHEMPQANSAEVEEFRKYIRASDAERAAF